MAGFLVKEKRAERALLKDVKVHYNSAAPVSRNGLAYTNRNPVKMNFKQECSLPHELGTVIQQKLGIVRAKAKFPKGKLGNPEVGFERQADCVIQRCDEQSNSDSGEGAFVSGTNLRSNKQRGNFGEMRADSYFESRGWKRISSNKVESIDAKIHPGIDGVYFKADEAPPYLIGEAKFNTAQLGNTRDGMQMSDSWIMGSNRLVNAVGAEEASTIIKTGYKKVIARVALDGKVTPEEL